jgi:hypothetical protein
MLKFSEFISYRFEQHYGRLMSYDVKLLMGLISRLNQHVGLLESQRWYDEVQRSSWFELDIQQLEWDQRRQLTGHRTTPPICTSWIQRFFLQRSVLKVNWMFKTEWNIWVRQYSFYTQMDERIFRYKIVCSSTCIWVVTHCFG